MMKWDGKGERPDGFRFEELDDTELARICEKRMEATTHTGDELRRVVIFGPSDLSAAEERSNKGFCNRRS